MADFEKEKKSRQWLISSLHYPREFIPFMTFRGTRIIDTRRGIDPTEIYRDEVAPFFFLNHYFKFTIFHEIRSYIKFRCEEEEERKNKIRFPHTLLIKISISNLLLFIL